jgi:ketosteroid isomerase-like protein
MSQKHVEMVRRAFRDWDEQGPKGFLPAFHDDVEYFPMEDRGLVRGHDGFLRYFAEWLDTWEDYQHRLIEARASGGDVVVGIAMGARGGSSGVDVAMEFWQVWHFRAGLTSRIDEYVNRAEALEAVGLSE